MRKIGSTAIITQEIPHAHTGEVVTIIDVMQEEEGPAYTAEKANGDTVVVFEEELEA